MPIREVNSPINNRKASGLPLSPGARSMPGRGDETGKPAPMPPADAHVSSGGGDQPAEFHATGPSEDE
jgi:hypothetical protein